MVIPNAAQTPSSLGGAPRIRLLNVKYSPNLGDGLLSICLERALLAAGAREAQSIDLAARTAFGDTLAGRQSVMAILDRLPPSLRRPALAAPMAYFAHKKWKPHYVRELTDADHVVIGGGNLLTDMDLNFPTKINLACEEAAIRQLPLTIYGVGVGATWSKKGTSLFDRAFMASGRLRAVFVRDEMSKANWQKHLGDRSRVEAEVVRDPGLLAVETFPARVDEPSEEPLVGIGVMSPVAVRYHADNAVSAVTLRQWYEDLAAALAQRGYRICAFTNGSPEDVAFLAELAPSLRRAAGGEDRITFQQPGTPEALCAVISGCDAVVAFRMHAIIAAYSYNKPILAQSWDPKLDAFMASVGLDDALIDANKVDGAAAANMVSGLVRPDFRHENYDGVLAETRADVERVYRAIIA